MKTVAQKMGIKENTRSIFLVFQKMKSKQWIFQIFNYPKL